MVIKLIDTTKGKVEVSFVGTGTPLLFVHGGHSSCNETLFHKGFDTAKFTLITPSRPGYGQTPLQVNTSPKITANLFIALLDVLKLQDVTVVGISAGGLTAIELAANFPDRVKKLVLISAVTEKWLTKQDSNYKKGKKLFSPQMEKYSWALFRSLYAVFPGLMAKLMFKELSHYRPIQFTDDEIKELKEMVSKQRSYSGFVNDLDQTIEDGVLEKIMSPTFILHSLHDNTVGLHHATTAKAKIKGSTLKTYNNRWGHLLWLGKESTGLIVDAVSFISQ